MCEIQEIANVWLGTRTSLWINHRDHDFAQSAWKASSVLLIIKKINNLNSLS